MAASIAMIAMTTKSSMSVNPDKEERRIETKFIAAIITGVPSQSFADALKSALFGGSAQGYRGLRPEMIICVAGRPWNARPNLQPIALALSADSFTPSPGHGARCVRRAGAREARQGSGDPDFRVFGAP